VCIAFAVSLSVVLDSILICCCSKAVIGTRWQNLSSLLLHPTMLVVSELPRVKDLVKIVTKIPEFAMLGMSVCFSIFTSSSSSAYRAHETASQKVCPNICCNFGNC